MKKQEPIIAYDHLQDEYSEISLPVHHPPKSDMANTLLYLGEELLIIMLFTSMILML